MDSPRFYDLSPGTPEKAKLNFVVPQRVPFGSDLYEESDITDLDSQEVSFDLNSFIGGDPSLGDLLGNNVKQPGLATSSDSPHNSFRTPVIAAGFGTAPGAQHQPPPSYTTLQIKQEGGPAASSVDDSGCHRHSQLSAGGSVLTSTSSGYDYLPVTTVAHSPGTSSNKSSSSSRSKKQADKSSDEYRKRRERNNIAVRKSREKAKIRSRNTEERVSELMKENDGLHKRLELLTKELNVLRSLFNNVGGGPNGVMHDDEIAKSLAASGHSSYRLPEQ